MQTETIINEIRNLSKAQRLLIEETLKALRKEEIENELEIGAKIMHDEYLNDRELTIFTENNYEEFYEAK